MLDFYLFIPGIHYGGQDVTFHAQEGSTQYDISHCIVTVGSMTSSLDIAEPIVDSSAFVVELASDAAVDFGGYTCVADLFSRDPEVYGECQLAQGPNPTRLMFTAAAAPGNDILVCAGVTTYYCATTSYSAGVATCAGPVNWGSSAQSALSYDASINRGTPVSKYPQQWKGRMAYLYMRAPVTDQWILYRACYLTENPQFTLSTVQLAMAPVDARIRDGVGAPQEAQVARFHSSTRTYSGTVHDRLAFSVGYLERSGPIYAEIASAQISLTANTAAYNALYPVVQPAGIPSGSMPISDGGSPGTPMSPPIDPGYGTGKQKAYCITNKSGTTCYTDTVPTVTSQTFAVLPTLRVYSATPSSVANRIPSIVTRSQTRISSPTTPNDAEPIVQLTSGSYRRPIEQLNMSFVLPSVTSAPCDVYYGFIWEETQDEEQATIGADVLRWKNLAWFLRGNIGFPRNAFTLADSGAAWETYYQHCDRYSIKLLNPQREYSLTGSKLPEVDHAGAYVRCGFCSANTDGQLTIGSASLWWSYGEESFCLDTMFGADGDEVLLQAEWTEDPDAEKTFSRLIKATVNYTTLSGCYRYDIIEQPDCAGIGDWFGYRASFRQAQAYSGKKDGRLIWSYICGSDTTPSALFIPQNLVDLSSFVSLSADFGCIREYIFTEPKDMVDNLASLLLLGGTGISFSADGYTIRRLYLGRAMKDERAVVISDDDILSIPRAIKDDHVVSGYEIDLPRGLSVTYQDALARSLYSDSSSIQLDLSNSRSPRMTDDEVYIGAKASLANMVNLLSNERMKWSFGVSFEKGCLLTPGALVDLTCSLTVGAATTPPPSNQLCRVVEVTQDPLANRTDVTVAATAGGGARYQRGCTVKSWNTSTYVYTVDDASWISAGQTIYYAGGSTTVSSATATTFTLSSMIYATAWWRSADSSRFLTASDYLA